MILAVDVKKQNTYTVRGDDGVSIAEVRVHGIRDEVILKNKNTIHQMCEKETPVYKILKGLDKEMFKQQVLYLDSLNTPEADGLSNFLYELRSAMVTEELATEQEVFNVQPD